MAHERIEDDMRRAWLYAFRRKTSFSTYELSLYYLRELPSLCISRYLYDWLVSVSGLSLLRDVYILLSINRAGFAAEAPFHLRARACCSLAFREVAAPIIFYLCLVIIIRRVA